MPLSLRFTSVVSLFGLLFALNSCRHYLKTQLLVSLQTGEIIALAFSNGKKHDFQLFKDSRIHVKAETVLEADSGYQGELNCYAAAKGFEQ